MGEGRAHPCIRSEIGYWIILGCLAYIGLSLKVVYSAQIHEAEPNRVRMKTAHCSTPPLSPAPILLVHQVGFRTTRAHSAEIGNDLGDRNTMTFPLSATTHEKSLFTYFLCGRKKRSKMSRPRFLSLFPPVSRPSSQTYLKFDQKENGTVPFEFFPPLTAFEHSSSAPCPRVSLMAPSRVL